jgi:hypothetical protein
VVVVVVVVVLVVAVVAVVVVACPKTCPTKPRSLDNLETQPLSADQADEPWLSKVCLGSVMDQKTATKTSIAYMFQEAVAIVLQSADGVASGEALAKIYPHAHVHVILHLYVDMHACVASCYLCVEWMRQASHFDGKMEKAPHFAQMRGRRHVPLKLGCMYMYIYIYAAFVLLGHVSSWGHVRTCGM